ncbi:hypothetical protein NCCP2331_10290 [Sporosarcina sp. NCCP-2331]|nr:hypothetical protein NCCP2331_10290 [Sporosarcina sp. NCCP-2331]GLB54986.1 hypothetical protein NCCP2378_07710 [Sporosarcina sp. NCCP-2378]
MGAEGGGMSGRRECMIMRGGLNDHPALRYDHADRVNQRWLGLKDHLMRDWCGSESFLRVDSSFGTATKRLNGAADAVFRAVRRRFGSLT